jgi:hypothetical protein
VTLTTVPTSSGAAGNVNNRALASVQSQQALAKPTGTVTFTVQKTGGPITTMCAAKPLDALGKTTACSLSSLTAGQWKITANYNGDSRYTTATKERTITLS